MSNNLIIDYQSDLELLRSSAVAAGIVASSYYNRNIKSWQKDNASPVTEADYLVDKLLYENLIGERPNYGWLSEESKDDFSRLNKKRCFIVDPIDGTRAFMRGDDCWTISLAISEGNEIIAGVIFAPARDELYYGAKEIGAFYNGERIKLEDKRNSTPIITALPALEKQLKQKGIDYKPSPSFPSLAYRLVQVAVGKIDVAVARRGSHDWDIGAADIILSESGLLLEDVCKGRPQYNKREIRHGALAVSNNKDIKTQIYGALREIYGCPDNERSENNE